MKSIAIIGLGLIGGSAAKAVKRNPDVVVIGWDIDASVCQAAFCGGIVDRVWDGKSILEADLTVLATPPLAAVEFLRNNAHLIKKDSVVTDMCGVKTAVVYDCEKICKEHGLNFLGGHPMAGKEKGGLKNASDNLFDGASFIITPTSSTTPEAMKSVWYFTTLLGTASPTVSTPEKHDRIIAFTSQLPHVLAGAYVKSPVLSERKGFSAGSFQDVSRVATADERLWTELFMLNKDNLCQEIDTIVKNLLNYKDGIQRGDFNAVNDLIKTGRILKQTNL